MRLTRASSVAVVALAAVVIGAPSAAAKKKEPLVVCKQGCEYRTIQAAVDDSGKNAVIEVEPGKYKEGVIVEGRKHNGLTIAGTGKNPKKVILEGKGASNENGVAQHGIEGIGVKNLTMENMWARNYATNGFFVHSTTNKPSSCAGYLMKDLRASFNRAYGLYAFECIGGRITNSVGYGHGDSAFYIGATPIQAKPKWTKLDHLEGYKNVIGFSGTNSHYVKITKSDFYNNGVGVVPSTLDSEPYEPNGNGIIEKNNIFWNNFNYFLPGSPVKTVSRGLGEPLPGVQINYPTGVGVVLLGSDGWIVRDNEIFGHYKWGAAPISDPFNDGDDAISKNNQFIENAMGRGGTDTNAVDFFNDGSGSGNCFSGNISSTFDLSGSATEAFLYPGCPAPAPPAAGTGTSAADSDQFGDLVDYVAASPPEKQECSWTKHPHPAFKKFKPFEVGGGVCP